jgi:DNA-binding NarL/FixJ family response regulator
MKLLAIDDHVLFLQGLKFLLTDLQGGLEFIEASTLAAALEIEDKASIDFILLDYHLPDSEGENALGALKEAYENAVIVVLSGEENPDLIKATIDAGAAGFIPKTSTRGILIAALQLILAGGVYIPNLAMHGNPAAAPQQNGSSEERSSAIESLSKRQLEVLARAVQGKPNKVIARELYIAEGTVKAHLSAAFQALGVANRTEAVYAAAKLRLIDV